MHCHEAQRQLETRDRIAAGSELEEHLSTCEDCREYARESRLVTLLQSLPVREPASGFEDRVIHNALRPAGNHRVHARWAIASAASVILAVFLTMQYFPGSGQSESVKQVQSTVVEVKPGETHYVNVRLNSPRTMSDALVKVRLDDNVELDGYQGIRNLEWRTTIKSGANQLSLPVRLLEKNSGTMTVVLEHGGARKRFSIQVNAAPDSENGHTLTMA